MAAELAASHEIAETDPGWAYPALVTKWGERYYQCERELAEEMLNDLDALRT